MKIKLIWVILLFAMFFLAACSATEGPELIAAIPHDQPIAIYPQLYETSRIYHATLDLEVSHVERAAERAKEVSFEQGGYLISSESWFQDGKKHANLVLAVPARHFEKAYTELLRLGALNGEWISSELVDLSSPYEEVFSQITIYLHPRTSKIPAFSLPDWRPVRTFEKAWGVFVSIFGFLVDIVIWIVVVAGPFVLIGWMTKNMIQWWQRKRS